MGSFDLEAIKKLIRMGGLELAQELMERFLDEALPRVEASLRGLESADLGAVESNCHRICSDSGWLGARGVQEAASQAEILAADGLVAALPEALQRLHGLVVPACEELRQLREGSDFCDFE